MELRAARRYPGDVSLDGATCERVTDYRARRLGCARDTLTGTSATVLPGRTNSSEVRLARTAGFVWYGTYAAVDLDRADAGPGIGVGSTD